MRAQTICERDLPAFNPVCLHRPSCSRAGASRLGSATAPGGGSSSRIRFASVWSGLLLICYSTPADLGIQGDRTDRGTPPELGQPIRAERRDSTSTTSNPLTQVRILPGVRFRDGSPLAHPTALGPGSLARASVLLAESSKWSGLFALARPASSFSTDGNDSVDSRHTAGEHEMNVSGSGPLILVQGTSPCYT